MAKPNPVLVELGNLASRMMRVEANILAAIEKQPPDHASLLDRITCEPALVRLDATGVAVLRARLEAAGFDANEAHLLASAQNLLLDAVAALEAK